MRVGLLTLGFAAALMSTEASAEIWIASWNLNNLRHRLTTVTLDWPQTFNEGEVVEDASKREMAEASSNAPLATSVLPPPHVYSKLDPTQVTLSGISSGGFFAHQFHVAYSGLVNGAAVMAGGPYACAEHVPVTLTFNPFASIITALGVCTHGARATFDPWGLWLPDRPSAQDSVTTTTAEHAAGRIDDPANLADDRVWLLAGRQDGIVPLSTVEVLESYYQSMGLSAPALHLEFDMNANHGVPIEEFTGTSDHPKRACGDYGLPFLIDCNYDAAERLLRHLYPQGFSAEPAVPDRNRLFEFDQTMFFDPSEMGISLNDAGYVYVPADCLNEATSNEACHLHVAFHGCQQYADLIDDDFYWDGGYNAWAEANRIIVFYPQTTAWDRPSDMTGLTANPKGCWDWWGYSGGDYFRKDGKQMQAVRAMIDHLLPD